MCLLSVYVVEGFKLLAELLRVGMLREQFTDPQANTLGGPAQVGLEDLTYIHSRWHTKRVKHNVDRGAIGHKRHVFHRHDARHHTFVAMTARHLIAGLKTTLHREVYLYHLEHARGQFVALGELFALFFISEIELMALLLDGFLK